MTKIGLVNSVYDKLGISRRESVEIVDLFFEIVKGRLSKGESVKISGLGKFMVKQKHAKKGRNFYTGEEVEIARRKVLVFKLSHVLKGEINE